MPRFFVTAIDTDSGKTVVSAILCEALGADYWKPVQAGFPRDLDFVKAWVSNKKVSFHEESYLLNTPASPHASARMDNVLISINGMVVPKSETLVIEGAGGCLVPLNDSDFVIDIASRMDCEVVLVSNLYLGSINHTLLTANVLKERNLKVKGIIFNGESNPESQRIILKHTGYRQLLHVKKEPEINSEVVRRYAQELIKNWNS